LEKAGAVKKKKWKIEGGKKSEANADGSILADSGKKRESSFRTDRGTEKKKDKDGNQQNGGTPTEGILKEKLSSWY